MIVKKFEFELDIIVEILLLTPFPVFGYPGFLEF
jgi:hypothetical protein